jgi:hypothetical protein
MTDVGGVALSSTLWQKTGFLPNLQSYCAPASCHLMPVRFEKSSFSPRRKRGFRLRLKVCDADNVNRIVKRGLIADFQDKF